MFGRPAWLLAVKFDSCRTCYHPFILIVSKFLFWFLNPNWVLLQNILWITFTPRYLQLHIDHSVLQTAMFFLFRKLEPLWPKLDPLQPLGTPFGTLLLLIFA